MWNFDKANGRILLRTAGRLSKRMYFDGLLRPYSGKFSGCPCGESYDYDASNSFIDYLKGCKPSCPFWQNMDPQIRQNLERLLMAAYIRMLPYLGEPK